ncbi:MAG: GIY-YIG nuclease family protein [Candidatus Tyrphobacter sp.]
MTTNEPPPSPALSFNDLLRKGGYDLKKVRLLRHREQRALKGRSVFELWRNDRPDFDRYQAEQALTAHKSFINSTHWASFIVTPQDETMFVGLYRVRYIGPSTADSISPTTGEAWPAGTFHVYEVLPESFLSEFSERLFIDWGDAPRAWLQVASNQEKTITEIRREYKDPAFPGYQKFIANLSHIPSLAPTWIDVLKNARGVYVLTCPRTKELYIGSAYGADGFFGRWMEYAATGHGGNVQLRRREPSDYQVAILEVAGSSHNADDIIAMETVWKQKFQTREPGFGLNSN